MDLSHSLLFKKTPELSKIPESPFCFKEINILRYEGPIYRPPSEADSLLLQATIGCPHNRCTFCMVYKNGPRFRIRPVHEIREDLLDAKKLHGSRVQTLFLPAGNTIAMKTEQLAEVCCFARSIFPGLERITVYGSSQFIHMKGPEQLKALARSGLSRIHVGLESGDDVILKRIRKGTHGQQQIEVCQWVLRAGIEVSLYVILGVGGQARNDRPDQAGPLDRDHGGRLPPSPAA